MKRTVLFLLTFGFIFLSYSQGIKRFSVCDDIMPVKVKRNDTIIISCDSAFILNRPTFYLYDNTYNRFRKNGASIKELMISYESLIKTQEERIRQQTQEYNELMKTFRETSQITLNKVDSSSAKLTNVNENLNTVNINISEVNKSINSAIKDIKQEQDDKWKRNLKWGIGGFAIGISTGVILFAILN